MSRDLAKVEHLENGAIKATVQLAGPAILVLIRRSNGMMTARLSIGDRELLVIEPTPEGSIRSANWNALKPAKESLEDLRRRAVEVMDKAPRLELEDPNGSD